MIRNSSRAIDRYRRFFSLHEFEEDRSLLWIAGALLCTFFITIERWFTEQVFTKSSTFFEAPNTSHLCWPYWTECGNYYFYDLFPFSYSGHIVLVALLCGIFLGFRYLYEQNIVRLHICLLVLFFIKLFGVFFFSYKASGNYDYYDLLFLGVLLFIPFKVFFLRLTFVTLYFIAAPLKFDESWIIGQYFSSLHLGLPLFPDWTIPVLTNFVIFLQVIGTWFLLSSKKSIQSVAYGFFLLFHVYSGFIVGYRYLLSTIPILHILFSKGDLPRFYFPQTIRALPGIMLILLLFMSQVWVTFGFSNDRKLTLEGNRYSLYMFEANHQCQSSISFKDPEGKDWGYTPWSKHAMNRCSPYHDWFFIQGKCKQYNNDIIVRWTFDHSVNGSPFYRIVDEYDACKLEYNAFSKNDWIRDTRDPSFIVGYPQKSDL